MGKEWVWIGDVMMDLTSLPLLSEKSFIKPSNTLESMIEAILHLQPLLVEIFSFFIHVLIECIVYCSEVG